jgi:hypothetical protein
MKTMNWANIPKAPKFDGRCGNGMGAAGTSFFDALPHALADARPLPGEEARYMQVLAVLQAANAAPKLKDAMTKQATSRPSGAM